jgi:hypothetical protein
VAWNAAKRTQRVGRGLGKRANKLMESAAQANKPTVIAVEQKAPIGGMATPPGHNGGGAKRQNKATVELDGIAPIGWTLPTSSGNVRVARARRFSVHPVGGIGPPVPTDPAGADGHARGAGPGDGSDGSRLGRSGLAAPVRVRPFPRCGYRFDDPVREDGQALRPDRSGMSGWEARGM